MTQSLDVHGIGTIGPDSGMELVSSSGDGLFRVVALVVECDPGACDMVGGLGAELREARCRRCFILRRADGGSLVRPHGAHSLLDRASRAGAPSP